MSTIARHPCPVTGCGRLVDNDKLACPAHWALVPRPIQSEVYATYRARQFAPLDAIDKIARRRAHETAMAKAIAAMGRR